MSRLVFLDTETTGLDPNIEEVFEIAVIEQGGTEHVWRLQPYDITVAFMHPKAAEVNRYHERISHPDWKWDALQEGDSQAIGPDWVKALDAIHATLDGAHIVGAVPDFDTRFLAALYENAERPCPRWHYHLIDIESVAIGYLAAGGHYLNLPWDSEELSQRLGITVPEGNHRHTALGDARWIREMWFAMDLDTGVVTR